MAYRPTSTAYRQRDPSYELQSRYSQQFDTDRSGPASPASPITTTTAAAGPPPGLLRDQQANARYSSADLYALEQAPAPPSHASGSSLLARPPNDSRAARRSREALDEDDDDDEDNEEGAGFGTYRDLTPAGARGAARYSQPPPFVSYPTATTSYSGYDLHNASKDALASTTKFGSETIEAPVLARTDWAQGESAREKHEHSTEKKRKKRQELAGEVTGLRNSVTGKLRRNWKWLLPLFLFLSVAAIVLCYFLVPRTPTITFNSPKVPKPAFTSDDTEPYVSSADPTSFKFNGNIIFAIDASDSYLPVKYNSFGLTVRMQETEGIIAQATWGNGEISVPARKVTSYEFPITFYGNYTSSSNPTFAAVRSACAHKYATVYRPPLNLTVTVSSSITGVVNSPDRTARLNAVTCPVEWASTAS